MMVIAGPGVTCAVIGLAWGKGTPFAITPLAVAAVTAKQTTSIISVVLEVVHHTNLVTNLWMLLLPSQLQANPQSQRCSRVNPQQHHRQKKKEKDPRSPFICLSQMMRPAVVAKKTRTTKAMGKKQTTFAQRTLTPRKKRRRTMEAAETTKVRNCFNVYNAPPPKLMPGHPAFGITWKMFMVQRQKPRKTRQKKQPRRKKEKEKTARTWKHKRRKKMKWFLRLAIRLICLLWTTPNEWKSSLPLLHATVATTIPQAVLHYSHWMGVTLILLHYWQLFVNLVVSTMYINIKNGKMCNRNLVYRRSRRLFLLPPPPPRRRRHHPPAAPPRRCNWTRYTRRTFIPPMVVE